MEGGLSGSWSADRRYGSVVLLDSGPRPDSGNETGRAFARACVPRRHRPRDLGACGHLAVYRTDLSLLILASAASGAALVVVAVIMVSVNVGARPAENSLVARYAPSNRRGLAFGLKFILAFGISGLGVKLEGVLYDQTGGFAWLFVVLCAIAAVGVAATLLLPSEDRVRASSVAVE